MHRTVPVPGGDLAVEVDGRGPPVVFIHGWAVDRRMWSHQLPAFRRRFTTITYDRRGSGESSAPWDLRTELEDLDAILGELGLGQVRLVGMSQGGRIALRYAVTRGARVAALVLQGAPLDDREPPPGDASILPLERYGELLRNGDRAALVRELGTHALMRAGSRYPAVQAEIFAMLSDYRGEDLLERSPPASASQPMTTAYLASIHCRTLVVTGSEELLWLRSVADRMARNIRGARRRVIRGGGHFVNMTHVGYYNRCVIEFLLSVTQPWNEPASDSA